MSRSPEMVSVRGGGEATSAFQSSDVSRHVLDPLKRGGWDDWLQSHPEATVFHSTAWTRVLSETYGYRPHFWAVHDERRSGFLPVLEVDSPLTGRRGVCLPFTDECQPLVSDALTYRSMLREVLRYGEARRWRYLECRGGRKLLEGVPASLCFYRHTLELCPDEGRLFGRCKDGVRGTIKKAERVGLKVELSQSQEAMRTFYSLHCRTRQRRGLPPQPFSFFSNICQHILSKNLGFVAVARNGTAPISAAVFFHTRKQAVYKFAASDHAFRHWGGNSLVLWEAIKWYAGHGFGSLDFGRTSIIHEGLRSFKRAWATKEEQIEYFKFDFRKGCFVLDKDNVFGWYNRVFKMMPVWLSRLTGALVYRHMA
jgi:hypothetical protein